MRRKLLLIAAVVVLAGSGLAAASSKTEAASTTAGEQNSLTAVRRLGAQIASLQQTTWHWQWLMGRPRTESHGRVLTRMSLQDVRRALVLWQARAQSALRQAQNPPHLSAWLCIHRYEGSWKDSGGPYYGGLQMDISFQRHYGGGLLRAKGTAEHWTPLEQIWVAERARRSGRGFYPWPNTARSCGLI